MMHALKQMIKAVMWGVALLTSILLTTGGVAISHLHFSSLRDPDETPSRAAEIAREVDVGVLALRQESTRYSFYVIAEKYSQPGDEYVDRYPIYKSITEKEKDLNDLLDSFCGEDSFGCYFNFSDHRYKFYSPITLPTDDFMGRVESMAAWSDDLRHFILRQSDPASIKLENLRRVQSLVGSLALTLLGAYSLFALTHFKKVSFLSYMIIAVVLVPGILISMYGATMYVHPADGLPISGLPAGFQLFMWITLILYPFSVVLPGYITLRKRQIQLTSVMMFWREKERPATT